jgi:archaellum biogenesis protein FlaJ (TadC family)
LDNFLSYFNFDNDTILVLTGISVITFLVSLILLPWLILLIPADYFVEKKRHPMQWKHSFIGVRLALIILKNILGLVLLVLGIFMLVLPGQGILTILAGLVLLDFPGKFLLLRWLARKERVLRSLNWIRKKGHKEPFIS